MRYAKICVLLLFLVASARIASADYLNILRTVGCGPPSPCDSQIYINGPGSPAAGYAMFPVITTIGSRWSFTFQTPDPYEWGFNQFGYYAYFGNGGTFQMTGPGDLTLLGEMRGGFLFNSNGEAYVLDLNFDGQWSNGLNASGQLYLHVGDFREAHLDVATVTATGVPEPTGFALLGSAVAGLCGARGRLRT